jgi:glyoxylase-like metal-dependent hydrolase (beta-lactamase superfamily II)
MKPSMLFLTLLLLVTASLCWAQQPYQPNGEVDLIPVSGKVYLLRSNSRIGNPNIAAFVGTDGILLVDASFASFAGKVTAKLKELSSARIKFVVNTHWHGDHTGGDEWFGPDATIVARSKTRERLMKQGLLEDNGRLLATKGLPTITFDSDLAFYFNDEEVRVIAPPPGHTDGDAIVYFAKSHVLAIGDYFFVDRFPVIDVEESGANLEGYLKTIKYLIDNFPSDTKIVPGHSAFWPGELKVSQLTDLKAYYEILQDSITSIRRRMAEGQSLEQIQKSGLPERFNAFEQRPRFVSAAKWIESVFNNLKSIGTKTQDHRLKN